KHFTNQAETKLTSLAHQVGTIIEDDGNQKEARDTAWKIVDTHAIEALIVDSSGHHWSSPPQRELPNLSFSAFQKDNTFSGVLNNGESVVKMGEFPVKKNGELQNKNILIVGVPLHLNKGQGAIFLYQSLETINHTIHQTKNLIFISA